MWKRVSDIFISVRRSVFCKEKLNLAETVTVTSKGQITIPSQLRKELKIREGEKLLVIREDDSIKIIPMPKLSNLAGVDKELFKGKKPSAHIEATRREWTKEFENRIRKA
jgi:AbrB family looped-hinge helix DNA binding protein